ncbi:MAG: Phosphatidylinositol mannoside acyltransferase [Dehalococcoidia bacterium]|nr:Phosphatidylinositol mannoside acyltransferase [Chloroflexota bacterium]
MWKYYAFKIAGFTLSYLPKKVGYLIARLIADAVYMLSPALRAAIADNMRHVLGSEADDAALKQAVRGVLRNTAKNYFDLIKIPHMKLNDIESCITVHGWHNLEDALKKGKGVILVTAHLGSFDIAVQIFAVRSIKTTVLVEPLEPPSLLKFITALRESNGVAFVPAQSGVLKVLIQSLRRGEAVLLACDRDIASNGLKSNFFGEETILPGDAVRIAMRTGATVVPVFNLRRGDDRYDVYFEPAIDVIPAGSGAVARNMEQVAHVMEKYIRSCPEQWVVLSRIWASE